MSTNSGLTHRAAKLGELVLTQQAILQLYPSRANKGALLARPLEQTIDLPRPRRRTEIFGHPHVDSILRRDSQRRVPADVVCVKNHLDFAAIKDAPATGQSDDRENQPEDQRRVTNRHLESIGCPSTGLNKPLP